MGWLYFTGVDLSLPAPLTRYLPGRVVWEGASDEAVGALPEQVVARAIGIAGAKDARQRPPRSGKILIWVINVFYL